MRSLFRVVNPGISITLQGFVELLSVGMVQPRVGYCPSSQKGWLDREELAVQRGFAGRGLGEGPGRA
jgi:hypothetical protein